MPRPRVARGATQRAAACFRIGPAHSGHHILQRHIIGPQLMRIDAHLIFFDKTANTGYLGNTVNRGQFKPHKPIL